MLDEEEKKEGEEVELPDEALDRVKYQESDDDGLAAS
jgi:hypothetical protein